MRHEYPNGVRRRLLRFSLSLVAFIQVDKAAAAGRGVDFGSTIDTAGRQRMLTQRIVKAYCQMGLDVARDVSRSQLMGAVDRFEKQLAGLARAAPAPDVRKASANVAKAWAPFKREALGPVSREGARKLAVQSESLLAGTNEVVHMLQEVAGTPQARLVNVAGRQRMLSQRLAKLYMLRAWEVRISGLREDMDAAAAEFEGALASLEAVRFAAGPCAGTGAVMPLRPGKPHAPSGRSASPSRCRRA